MKEHATKSTLNNRSHSSRTNNAHQPFFNTAVGFFNPEVTQKKEAPFFSDTPDHPFFNPIQRQEMEEEEPLQGRFKTIQRQGSSEEEELMQGKFDPQPQQANKTGLPDQLKTGIEHLSGYSMDDVKVHYNSQKPPQLQAHAYAQGKDIHVASGQEKHLPHEAWHVVQQKQGRVQPTMQMKGKVNVNDDVGLEREADRMGTKAFTLGKDTFFSESTNPPRSMDERQLIHKVPNKEVATSTRLDVRQRVVQRTRLTTTLSSNNERDRLGRTRQTGTAVNELVEKYNVLDSESVDEVSIISTARKKKEILTEIIAECSRKVVTEGVKSPVKKKLMGRGRMVVYEILMKDAGKERTRMLTEYVNAQSRQAMSLNADQPTWEEAMALGGMNSNKNSETSVEANRGLLNEAGTSLFPTYKAASTTDTAFALKEGNSGILLAETNVTQIKGVWQAFKAIFENIKIAIDRLGNILVKDESVDDYASIEQSLSGAMEKSESFKNSPSFVTGLPLVGDIMGLISNVLFLVTDYGPWTVLRKANKAKISPLTRDNIIPSGGVTGIIKKKLGRLPTEGLSTIAYSLAKVKRRMVTRVYNVIKYIVKIGTFVAGAIGYPFVYTGTLVVDLFRVMKDAGKGIIKAISHTRGKNRAIAANNIIDIAVNNQNDIYAHAFLRSCGIKNDTVEALRIALDAGPEAYKRAKKPIHAKIAEKLRSK